jgi:hypothetical protein
MSTIDWNEGFDNCILELLGDDWEGEGKGIIHKFKKYIIRRYYIIRTRWST